MEVASPEPCDIAESRAITAGVNRVLKRPMVVRRKDDGQRRRSGALAVG